VVTPWSQRQANLSAHRHTIPAMARPEYRPAKDGTDAWRVRYRIGGRQSGETFYTLGAAQEFCDWIRVFGTERAVQLLATETAHLQPPAVLPTLDEWAERYIDALPGASGDTKDGYRSSYRHSFGTRIGMLRLDQVDREAVSRAIVDMQRAGGPRTKGGYSDKSIANHHGLLFGMMATAVLDRVITANPCAGVRLPRNSDHEKQPKRFLTPAEFQRLWSKIGAHHRPLIETLVGTGIRWGEAEALLVSDVDLAARLLHVTKAAKRSGDGRRIIGPTKTRRSRRTVSLPLELVETLEAVVRGRDDRERLFVAPRGGPLGHKVFWQDVWLPACAKAKLAEPRPRIHDLRHTYASWMIAEGVSMKALQESLGHESITTTMDLYGHLMPGAMEETAAAASRALARALPGRGKIRAA